MVNNFWQIKATNSYGYKKQYHKIMLEMLLDPIFGEERDSFVGEHRLRN